MDSRFRIEQITKQSPILRKVRELGDKNTKTLGFLAYAAYDDYAAKGNIYAAIDNSKEQLAGYVIFTISARTRWGKIHHFCIDDDYRGFGVSDVIFAYIKEISQVYKGIQLSCRVDDIYKPAHELWRRLGFTPLKQEKGRAKNESTFKIIWVYNHQHQTLFDTVETKLRIVVDSCVFYDFFAGNKPTYYERESLSLLQDWLFPEIELLVTPELKHEIVRNKNDYVREDQLNQAANYAVTSGDVEQISKLISEIEEILPIGSDNDRSDATHLAWCIIDERINSFITRDERILSAADAIYDRFKLTIQRPIDLLLDIDEQVRMEEYRQMRFAGTTHTLKRVQSHELNNLANNFLYSKEKKTEFLDVVRMFLLGRDNFDVYILEGSDEEKLALFVLARPNKDELLIPLFRINEKDIAKNLIDYLLLKFRSIAAAENRRITRITDEKIHELIKSALTQDTFIQSNTSWLKTNFNVILSALDMADYWAEALKHDEDANRFYKFHISILRDPQNVSNTVAMDEIERLLWPAIVSDANIPTISIPIDQVWASEWFDEELASQTLWGANTERAFNREGVYYSRKTNLPVQSPCRILWYVTKGQQKGTSSIRAYSRLENIVIGKPKDLYRQFDSLGIYEWTDLNHLVKGKLDTEIAAYRFSETYLLPNPISFEQWDEIARNLRDKGAAIYSPQIMPNEVFIELYKVGITSNP